MNSGGFLRTVHQEGECGVSGVGWAAHSTHGVEAGETFGRKPERKLEGPPLREGIGPVGCRREREVSLSLFLVVPEERGRVPVLMAFWSVFLLAANLSVVFVREPIDEKR